MDELFVLALNKAKKEYDLWWQVRALQELEWESELKELILENSKDIEKSQDLNLQLLLANFRGDAESSIVLHKKIADSTHIGNEDHVEIPEDDGEHVPNET